MTQSKQPNVGLKSNVADPMQRSVQGKGVQSQYSPQPMNSKGTSSQLGIPGTNNTKGGGFGTKQPNQPSPRLTNAGKMSVQSDYPSYGQSQTQSKTTKSGYRY